MSRTTGEAHRHGAKRRNAPSVEAAGAASKDKRKPKAKRLEGRGEERSAIPHLAWRRNREGRTIEAPVLAVAERIEPGAWLRELCRETPQGDLFGEAYNGFRNRAAAQVDWFQYEGHWQNRLIYGDSERVMAALLEHERMAGEVQMIYFDPPYGFDFDAKYADDATYVTQFRDAYRNKIHGYLDGLEATLTLGRELLCESGSLFMQIGDVNVHRTAMVLDEVFGPENRVGTIAYQTTGGGSSTKSLSKAGDWILWYAKNKERMKFSTLYEEQDTETWLKSQATYSGGDFPDGERRMLTSKERANPKGNLPDGIKLWRMGRLASMGASQGEQGEPFVHEGVQYGSKDPETGSQGDGLQSAQWRVDQEGLRKLATDGRLWSNQPAGTKMASLNALHLKVYQEEMLGKRLTNLWPETISPGEKLYSVQTGDKAIERCILMATDPGDLVLDPTNGSGTTAVVAERWGRRWIVSDACRGSIAAARERILTTEHPWLLLTASEEGFQRENQIRAEIGQELLEERPQCEENDPAGGIVVAGQKHVTAATLAYEGRPDKLKKQGLYVRHPNRPVDGKTGGRVTGPFTVETDATRIYESPEEARSPRRRKRDAAWSEQALERLKAGGVQASDSTQWDLVWTEPVEGKDTRIGRIAHRGVLEDRRSGRRRSAILAIWPDDVKVDPRAVMLNIEEARRLERLDETVLIIAGTDFAPEVRAGREDWVCEVMLAKAKAEVLLGRVDPNGRQSSFTVVAEPHVEVEAIADGRLKACLKGWSEFDPGSGNVRFQPMNGVKLWMLDTKYDGTHFCARRIHLTQQAREENQRRFLANVLGAQQDKEKVRTTWGYVSAPFEKPSILRPRIAVKVITTQDGELFGVIELD